MSPSKTTTKTNQAKPALAPREELVYQALETEMGGVEIYTAALQCVRNDDLRKEWKRYLEETKQHVEIVRELCLQLDLDPDRPTPGRETVRTIGKALVKAMHLALGSGDFGSAELVASECVTLAETKDHLNWVLIGEWARNSSDKRSAALQAAYDAVEDEEDEHLYHTAGWTRELWLKALGLSAQLPPPEEEQDVETQKEAAEAIEARRGSPVGLLETRNAMAKKKKKTYKGDDLSKTKQDRKRGGARYEPWEGRSGKKKSTSKRSARK